MKADDTRGFFPLGAVRTILGCGIVVFLIAQFRRRTHLLSKIPSSSEPPKFDPRSIPSLPSVRLSSETVDPFVRWVAAVPVADAQRVRDEIAVAREVYARQRLGGNQQFF